MNIERTLVFLNFLGIDYFFLEVHKPNDSRAEIILTKSQLSELLERTELKDAFAKVFALRDIAEDKNELYRRIIAASKKIPAGTYPYKMDADPYPVGIFPLETLPDQLTNQLEHEPEPEKGTFKGVICDCLLSVINFMLFIQEWDMHDDAEVARFICSLVQAGIPFDEEECEMLTMQLKVGPLFGTILTEPSKRGKPN